MPHDYFPFWHALHVRPECCANRGLETTPLRTLYVLHCESPRLLIFILFHLQVLTHIHNLSWQRNKWPVLVEWWRFSLRETWKIRSNFSKHLRFACALFFVFTLLNLRTRKTTCRRDSLTDSWITWRLALYNIEHGLWTRQKSRLWTEHKSCIVNNKRIKASVRFKLPHSEVRRPFFLLHFLFIYLLLFFALLLIISCSLLPRALEAMRAWQSYRKLELIVFLLDFAPPPSPSEKKTFIEYEFCVTARVSNGLVV